MAEIATTGIGSWPGTDFAAVVRLTLGEFSEFAYLPELPARGVYAGLIGRTVGLLGDLGVDLQPSGWRLLPGSASSVDQRRAAALLRDDLDQTEELAHQWTGPFAASLAGPWTMAASLELPRGGPVLADAGAVRDLIDAVAEGAAWLEHAVRCRLPGADVVVKVDEPALAAAGGGQVPTASGWGSVAAVDTPELDRGLRAVAERLASPVLHSCAAGADWATVIDCGYVPAVDMATLTAADWDVLGGALEAGRQLWLGVARTSPTGVVATADDLAEAALNVVLPLEIGGLADQLIFTPACGLVGWHQRDALSVVRAIRGAARVCSAELPVA